MGRTLFGYSVALLVIAAVSAQAQAPSLQEQLVAQYKLVKMGSDSSGPAVVDAGTILSVQKGGIMGVLYSDTNVLSTKYQDGAVHSPNSVLSKGLGFGMKRFGKEQTTHLFQVGEKIYPTKIDVNVAKDTVAMGIVACDTCNNTSPPTYYKATVVFQFAKGKLEKASAGEVEDTIGQLLAIKEDSQDQAQGGGQDQGQQASPAQAPQAAAAPQAAPPPQAEPQTIEKGQTPEQVQAALGKPEKIVNLGSKQLYIYKDMKVTFVNGKVSDVQ